MATSLKPHHLFAVVTRPNGSGKLRERHAHCFSFGLDPKLILPLTWSRIIINIYYTRVLSQPFFTSLNRFLKLTNSFWITSSQQFKFHRLPTGTNIFCLKDKAFYPRKATGCKSPITDKFLTCYISTFSINKLNCYGSYMAPTNPCIWTDLSLSSNLPHRAMHETHNRVFCI